jgi:type II secretory pathway pseudopilin PulG
MFNSKKQNKSGFTLIETIVALVLGALIIGVIMSVVVSGTRQSRSIKRTEKLHSDIVFLIDNLNYLIKQGQAVDVSGDSLKIFLLGSEEIIIEVDDEEIKINNNSFTNKNMIEVEDFSFTEMTNSVKVNISLKAKNNPEKASISTTIAYRN